MAGKLIPEKTYSKGAATILQYNGQFGPWVTQGFVSFDKEGGTVRKSSMSVKKFLSMDMESYCRNLLALHQAMQEQVAVPDGEQRTVANQQIPTRAIATAPVQEQNSGPNTGFESRAELDAVDAAEDKDTISW